MWKGEVEGEVLFFFLTFSSFEVWLKRKAQKGQLTLSKLQSVFKTSHRWPPCLARPGAATAFPRLRLEVSGFCRSGLKISSRDEHSFFSFFNFAVKIQLYCLFLCSYQEHHLHRSHNRSQSATITSASWLQKCSMEAGDGWLLRLPSWPSYLLMDHPSLWVYSTLSGSIPTSKARAWLPGWAPLCLEWD